MKRHTPARLGLGRSGPALPTRALLEFGIAHANARDAVHTEVDWPRLAKEVTSQTKLATIAVDSCATDRSSYLRRPDLGRRLSQASCQDLAAYTGDAPIEVAFVLADGLSAAALQNHGVGVLVAALEVLSGVNIGPVVLAHHARVALGDEIGEILKARFVVVAIGERPGLSSPDSLGLYLTYSPTRGKRDSERNCLSNIHRAGMSYTIAALKLAALIHGARRLGATGTALKDETDAHGLLGS